MFTTKEIITFVIFIIAFITFTTAVILDSILKPHDKSIEYLKKGDLVNSEKQKAIRELLLKIGVVGGIIDIIILVFFFNP